MQRIAGAHVAVIGLGGVGSWAVEALARAGVGKLTLVDLDDICVTNTNRQIHALEGTYGRSKAQVLAERVALIHPDCEVRALQEFYSEKSCDGILSGDFDVVIDAIDVTRPKAHLLATCWSRKIPVLTCGGAGGKKDPARIKTADLARSYGDGLLRELKRKLRREYGLPMQTEHDLIGIPCVFSDEPPVFPRCDGTTSCERDPEFAGRMGCEAGFGSVTTVTGTFGFFLAAGALDLISAAPDMPQSQAEE